MDRIKIIREALESAIEELPNAEDIRLLGDDLDHVTERIEEALNGEGEEQ